MASDPITWRNVAPISIADELMAYAKYSGGAGDALKGIGTSIDDMLQRKSTRDTEAFLAGADALPTAEARNAALQQAREGFNLINVGKVRKGLRATELHDFARTRRDEQAAQAADLLLTQKSKRDDIIADNLRADKRHKQLMINEANEAARLNEQIAQKYQELSTAEEQFGIEQAFKEEQEKSKIISQIKDRETQTEGFERADLRHEAKLEWEQQKYRDKEKNRRLALEDLERKSVKEKRKVKHFNAVRDSVDAIAAIKNDPTKWFDKKGNAISGDEAVRRHLETSITQGKDAGISETDLKPLIDQYNVFLDSDTLADKKGLYVTQADIDKAFPKTKKIAYTTAGRTRLENAVFRRLQSKYKSKTASTTTKLKEMAKKSVSSSAYAEKFDNPLIDADVAMETAIAPIPSSAMTGSSEKEVRILESLRNKSIVNAYKKELKKLQTRNPDDVQAFNDRHRKTALDAIDLNLGLESNTETKFPGDEGTEFEDGYDPKKAKKERIIDKPASQMTVDDLKRYDRDLMKQIKEGYGLRNITQAEFDQIKARNQDIAGGGIAAKFTAASKLIGYGVEIADITSAAMVKEETALAEAEAKQAATTADMHALVKLEGISQGVKPSYVKWLKDNNYEIPKPEAINNAVLRLEKILHKKMGGTATKFEKADLILNFLRSNVAGTDASGPTTEVIYDSNEDDFVNEGYNWPIISQIFGATSDQEITDAPASADNQLFRMMLQQSAKKMGKYQSIIDKGKIEDNKEIIKQATAELLKYGVSRKKDDSYTDSNYKSVVRDLGGIATLAPRSSADNIKMLKDEIARAEEANKKLRKTKN